VFDDRVRIRHVEQHLIEHDDVEPVTRVKGSRVRHLEPGMAQAAIASLLDGDPRYVNPDVAMRSVRANPGYEAAVAAADIKHACGRGNGPAVTANDGKARHLADVTEIVPPTCRVLRIPGRWIDPSRPAPY